MTATEPTTRAEPAAGPAEPTSAPVGYLDVADLDHVTYRELADRRAWLLDAIGSVGPGANHAGVRTAAIVLPAVLSELDMRARSYKAAADYYYRCTCGFRCIGLAIFDDHMDHPPGSPDSIEHLEVTEAAYAAAQAARVEQDCLS